MLKALYEMDLAHHDPQQVVERLAEEVGLPSEALLFARELVQGVLQHQRQIDATLRRLAPVFPLEQLAPLDRNILRLAIFEILYYGGVPVKAAINEAVELAKTFGSDTSPRFVNGVLGSVADPALQKESQERR